MSLLLKLKTHTKRFKSALLSNNPAAHYALIRSAILPFCRLLDTVLSLFSREDKDPFSLPTVILLCSPPRSGSTVLFQVITRALDCSYVTNLHQLFPHSARALLSYLGKYLDTPRELSSYYGHTKELMNVNEGNHLVDYWFKSMDTRSIRQRFIKSIRKIDSEKKPVIVLKNVKVYDRIFLLHQAVPELIFISIDRNTSQVVQSELKAFYELGYVNPIPDEIKNVSSEDAVNYVVKQIVSMKTTMQSQLRKIPGRQVVYWNYEQFCKQPRECLEQISQRTQTDSNWSKLNIDLYPSSSQKVSDEERDRIEKLLKIDCSN